MRKIIIFVALTVLVFVMSLPHTGFSAANEGKPIHATDIEIVKKAGIKGQLSVTHFIAKNEYSLLTNIHFAI